jgi:hypothetical protein
VHKKWREHSGIRVAVEGSLAALVVGAWLWGVVSLGAQAMVTQTFATSGGDLPGYVLACPAPQGTEKKSIRTADGGGEGCLRKVCPHLGTTRQPGAGFTEQANRRGT